jgi:hypothetical protein
MQASADAGALQDVSEVGEQTVRDVDAGMRQSRQRGSQGDARLRSVQAFQAVSGSGVC